MHSPQSPSPHLHAYVASDFVRAVIDTRTTDKEAEDRGLLILRRLDASGAWNRIEANRQLGRTLVRLMCLGLGRIESWSAGLIVRFSAKEIGTAAQIKPTSTYQPLIAVEAAGLIRRIPAGGNRADNYEVLMPPPGEGEPRDDAERAHPTTLAAQSARADARASLDNDTLAYRNPRTNNELARASARASLDNDAPCATGGPANAGFSTGNPLASLDARAGDSTVLSTPTPTFTSTRENLGTGRTGGRGEPTKEEGETRQDGWLLDWLLSLRDMKPWMARKLATNPLITQEIALAARHELEHSAASQKPNFAPAGLIVRILKNPQTQIGDEAWAYAEQQLAGAERRAGQFTGTRVADLFGEPGASPLSSGPRDGQSIEDRAVEIQQTIGKSELDALHREAANLMPPGLQRMCVSKADPRKLREVHALIVKRLQASAVGCA